MRAFQQQFSLGAHGNDATAGCDFNQTIDTGILPNRQSRAAGAPRFESFSVCSWTEQDPFEQLQSQGTRRGVPGFHMQDFVCAPVSCKVNPTFTASILGKPFREPD
jgi:hypothetical protein